MCKSGPIFFKTLFFAFFSYFVYSFEIQKGDVPQVVKQVANLSCFNLTLTFSISFLVFAISICKLINENETAAILKLVVTFSHFPN